MTSTPSPPAAAAAEPVERARLTRRRVLEAALAYVDEHGLDALTMRKLGAALGVEGTALYNHVQGKDGLLDGLVELLWSEVHAATDTTGSWQDVLRSSAGATREVVHRHPRIAPLLCSRSVIPLEALQLFAACLAPMEEAGFDREHAGRALCAMTGHAFGYAVMEQCARGPGANGDAPESESQRIRRVAQMLPRDISDDLFEVGLAICCCDTSAQFEAGVDLIIAGLHPPRRRP
ncbi:MAG: TetR/AcrR family transcriptional regulator C-terminal domain-containing protein [Acidimicrobiales bacterium]